MNSAAMHRCSFCGEPHHGGLAACAEYAEAAATPDADSAGRMPICPWCGRDAAYPVFTRWGATWHRECFQEARMSDPDHAL